MRCAADALRRTASRTARCFFKGKACLFDQKESAMHRNIGTAAVAFILFIGASGLSLAAETAAPSTKGVQGTPATGNTGSTHNPNPNAAAKETGMEPRGTEVGTDSTHNPTGKKD
jgi:hypothetical protein